MMRHKSIFFLACILTILTTYDLQLTTCYAESETTQLEVLFLDGKYDKTVSMAQSLINSHSRKRYEIYYIKGLSELKLNRYDDARSSFQYIIDRYPGSPRVFDAYVGIGDSYLLEGRTAKANDVYSEILRKFPDNKNIEIVRSRQGNSASGQKPVAMPSDIPRGESNGYFSVQVGSFKNSRNAEGVSKKLSREGFQSYVEIPAGPGDRLYRVKVGKLQSRESAEALASRLKIKGYKTSICAAQ